MGTETYIIIALVLFGITLTVIGIIKLTQQCNKPTKVEYRLIPRNMEENFVKEKNQHGYLFL